MDPATNLLVITGSMGSGKNAVAGEAYDILSKNGIVHAVLDLDALGTAYTGAGSPYELFRANLTAVCRNYRAAGVTKLLAAGAVESAAELQDIRKATGCVSTVVARLKADVATMEERLHTRETGLMRAGYLARVRRLEAILDAAALEDFVVVNDQRSITDVARELLERAGWL